MSRALAAPRRRPRNVRLVAAAATLGLAALAVPAGPAVAGGAPPSSPVLVAPADGAPSVSPGGALQVQVADADDTSLDVRFHAQARGAGTPAGDDFTLVVLPDTQNYVSTSADQAIMGVQTQWIADSRASLDTAFVAQVGDLVGVETSTTQWQRASTHMAVLDNAGVPNTVLPGNHDMNLTNGTAVLYDQYFPPSRYSAASWNSPTASYGGYLGDQQHGPDPVDRLNKDSYALFSAGGMEFLLLNLEFNPPDYAIDWAKRVLAAYPDRRAIVATHSYVDISGGLTTQVNRADGGNSGLQLWQKLVQPSCSIFMVVSGHFHDGELGEARRTDTNACGKPVLGLLSDYQDRARGGNGWLRYYTFKPALDQIQAVTYSPFLQQTETDADSAFTLPYDMPAPAVDLPQVGQVTAASGTTASLPLPTYPAGTTVDWYATVNDGTTTTRSATWSFTTAPPTPTVLAADGFGRSVTGGWGPADTGGTWTVAGGTTRFAVAGGTGVHSAPVGATLASSLGVSSTATDVTVSLSPDTTPTGAVYATVGGRVVGTGEYGARVKLLNTGVVQLHTARSGTVLTGGTVPGLTLTGGQKLSVRVQVQGTAPTTIRAKAWRTGTTEPGAWSTTTTDATAALQNPGGLRLTTYLSSSATSPLVLRWDDLTAAPIGTPPANVAPTASFTSTTNGLTASVNGTGSSDPDGVISSYAWTFGDGTTGTGATASRTYTAAGTYTVGLTVTDDDGATASTTRQVTVTAPPPMTVLAADAFARSVTSGWGTADTGGTWTVGGGATRFSVAAGTGVHTVPAGATLTSTLAGVSSTASDVTVALSPDTTPTGAVYATVTGRLVGTSEYGARVKLLDTGVVQLHTSRSGTVLTGGTVPGLTLTGGQKLNVRVQVQGTGPTTIRAKAWRTGTTEPAAWTTTTTDTTAALQSPGAVRLTTYLSSTATSPLVLRWDDLTAAPIGP